VALTRPADGDFLEPQGAAHVSGCQVTSINEGPPVAAARLSADGTLLAIQRSATAVEFYHRSSGNTFVQVRVCVRACSCLRSPLACPLPCFTCTHASPPLATTLAKPQTDRQVISISLGSAPQAAGYRSA
jgi:hypothetical protein